MFEGALNLATFKGLPKSPKNKMLTEEFLDAARYAIDTIEILFEIKVFTTVTNEMKNNADKIQTFCAQDMENRKYVESLVLCNQLDQEVKVHLLWLSRALEFCIKFLIYVADDKDIVNETSQNLSPHIIRAYSEVLEPFHKSSVREIFRVSLQIMTRFMKHNINFLK